MSRQIRSMASSGENFANFNVVIVGANVSGKPRIFSPYIGGFPEYVERCEQVVGDNYAGFTLI